VIEWPQAVSAINQEVSTPFSDAEVRQLLVLLEQENKIMVRDQSITFIAVRL
jgi:hypothetical protein